MKLFARLRDLLLVAIVLIAAGGRVKGQLVTNLTYSITSSASSVLVGQPVTISINITNSGLGNLNQLVVTDSLPTWVYIDGVGLGSAFGAEVTTNLEVYTLSPFDNENIFQGSLLVIPTQAGLFTNSVIITTASLLPAETNYLVINATNTIITANLGVILRPPTQAAIVGDQVSYGITVTNGGPDTAPDVLLTNTLPPGVILEGVLPTNQIPAVTSSNLIFDLGAIGPNSITNLEITVEPTNAGVLPFSAAVGSASVTNVSDLISATNAFLSVSNIEQGVLGVVTNSSQINDVEDGLEEQTILLTNISAGNVSAARVVVSGIPKALYNAVGTNGGNPYVTYVAPSASPLGNGQSVTLRLQYYPHGSFTFTNVSLQLQAYPVPVPGLTPPATTGTSRGINFNGIFRLSDGSMLLDFPATVGRTYTVVYSDNVEFSNALIAPPAFVAGANDIQWIDFGPPNTISAPTQTTARFYRIIQNQ